LFIGLVLVIVVVIAYSGDILTGMETLRVEKTIRRL